MASYGETAAAGAAQRGTRAVLDDHLRLRQQGDLETDLSRNYAGDVVVLTMEGKYRGHDGVRENARTLRGYFGPADFEFPVIRVEGRFAYIEWRVRHGEATTQDGADSFVIEDGRIVCQTIRYTVSHQNRA